jgi:hypothetical protein
MRIVRLVEFVAVLLVIAALCSANAQEAGTSRPNASSSKATFQLTVNPNFLSCLSGSSKSPPSATVTVVEGNLNDTLTINLKHFKSKLTFDLFTVENSQFLSDGTVDPAFVNFGLAWYQTDVNVNSAGSGSAKIQTILVNQIFGFDPAASLPPTNTFHVGFWFNNPNDAAACGFDVTKPTPFNGEHQAGPLAMESVPDATTGLGPLCLNPNTSTVPATCNP